MFQKPYQTPECRLGLDEDDGRQVHSTNRHSTILSMLV